MSKLLSLALLGLLILAFVSDVRVKAADAESKEEAKSEPEDEAPREDEDTDDLTLSAHPSVVVTWVFPDNPNRKLKLGDVVNIIAGFHNGADEAFNITGIGAHLRSPVDLDYYIQNFTARRVGAPVGPGQQAAAEYQFKPDPALEANEYWLSAWVIYNNSADQVFMHTFYNGTVELYEEAQGVKSLLTWGLVVAVIGVVVFILIQVNSVKVGGSRSKSVERGTRSEVTSSSSDLLIYKQSDKQRAFRRNTGNKGLIKSQSKNKIQASTSGDDSGH